VSLWLLDTNLLVALLWPAHRSHVAAQSWFAEEGQGSWATCPFTEAGFVRIVSNPAFSRDAVSPTAALEILTRNSASPQHRFLETSISLAGAVELVGVKLQGHQQITNAYLLGLALHHGASLATFDRGIEVLVNDSNRPALRLLQH
jgi:uncharacterized protein